MIEWVTLECQLRQETDRLSLIKGRLGVKNKLGLSGGRRVARDGKSLREEEGMERERERCYRSVDRNKTAFKICMLCILIQIPLRQSLSRNANSAPQIHPTVKWEYGSQESCSLCLNSSHCFISLEVGIKNKVFKGQRSSLSIVPALQLRYVTESWCFCSRPFSEYFTTSLAPGFSPSK